MKKYKFINSDNQMVEMTYSQLFRRFNGTFDENGKKIMPATAKRIIKVNKQGGTLKIKSKEVQKTPLQRKKYIIKETTTKQFIKKIRFIDTTKVKKTNFTSFFLYRTVKFKKFAFKFTSKILALRYLKTLNTSTKFSYRLITV